MLTHAIYTWRGEPILVTADVAAAAAKQYMAGADAIVVGGQMIARGAIARIGTHESTCEMLRVAEQDWIRSLPPSEQTAYRRKQMDSAQRAARLQQASDREAYARTYALGAGDAPVAMTAKEEERGDAMFYIDSVTGQKMYS